MAVTFYPVILVMYFVVRHQGRKKGALTFGIHLPSDPQMEEKIVQIRKDYNRQLLIFTLISVLIPLPAFRTSYVSIQFTIWILWFLGALCIMALPFINANAKVMAMKNEYAQQNEYAHNIRYAELTQVRKVHFPTFLIPIALSIACTLPLLFAGEAMEVYFGVAITLTVTTFSFYLIAAWMDRLPVSVISDNSQINVSYARARKNIWKNVWLGEAWINTVALLFITISALFSFHPILNLILSVSIEALAALLILFLGMTQLNQVERTYDKSHDEKFDLDDDRYWKWGMFYNNPMDKRSLINKRFGVGMTTNMASPAGKISMVVAVLALIWIPIMCIWMIFEDFTPIQVTVSEQAIVCVHLKEEYTIPLAEISAMELVTELPEWRTKSNGTATDTLEKGRFYSNEHGVYYEFLNPENEHFIQLKVKDKVYYLSGADDGATMDVWAELVENSSKP